MGICIFAESQGHSAKPKKHSANSMSSVTLGNNILGKKLFVIVFFLTRQTLCLSSQLSSKKKIKKTTREH